ncbi:MAG: UDP-glucuronic acid decarboxylase family protein [Pseudonocardiaceae bacterium]
MRVVVTGGAGFLGSHLCEALVRRGDSVVCVDDLSTGRRENIQQLMQNPAFSFVRGDVSHRVEVTGPVHAVLHLASPASPVDYLRLPLQTLAVGSRGTENALQLAHASGARFVLASTSEVYGDPLQHPQCESYWGNVNPIGLRSVYDEAKRYAEAVTMAYRRTLGTDGAIVRIFNTYGPRMRPRDGRVVSAFIVQALAGGPLTVHGDGSQTRSFCYVDDLVRGLVAMLDADIAGPINLGSTEEWTVAELAASILRITGSSAPVHYQPLPADDPARRRPDISVAQRDLVWSPEVSTDEGLRRTVSWFCDRPDEIAALADGLRVDGEMVISAGSSVTG